MRTQGLRFEQIGWRALIPSSIALAVMVSFALPLIGCGQDAAEPADVRAVEHDPPPDPNQPAPDPTPEELALHDAVANGDSDEIRRLVEEGVGIHSWNRDQVTPLHTAARLGQIDSMQTLIELGADVNARGRLNIRPLHWSVRAHNADATRVLLENGADPNVHAGVDNAITPLGFAQNRNLQEIVNLLIEHGAVE